jgi:hypothetical protein
MPQVPRTFHRFEPFVATTVFHWFLPAGGNLRGPWPPLGGRAQWDGGTAFWKRQIKQMMMANIDAIYLHCMNAFEEQRVTFFEAHAELRREGWDVPKIAPFLDPFYLWRTAPIDAATQQGKDEFTAHYIRFFRQFLLANQDDRASEYLLTIDDKLVLTTWFTYTMVTNQHQLARAEVEVRLRNRLLQQIPQLANGIHVISTAGIDPDLSFSDERMIAFSGYCYAMHSVCNLVDTWHVQPGYWDQNIRASGFFLPRDGGKMYRRAWEAVTANGVGVHRVYIESWNEYDEGSGIYAADPEGLFADRTLHQNVDVFSDTGDPFEYIETTARGAAVFNRLPGDDAEMLSYDLPASLQPGDSFTLRVLVRNTGNNRWTGRDGYGLQVGDYGLQVGDHVVPVNDEEDESPEYRGIFRGRPKWFSVSLSVPHQSDNLIISVSMARNDERFGKTLNVSLNVVSA